MTTKPGRHRRPRRTKVRSLRLAVALLVTSTGLLFATTASEALPAASFSFAPGAAVAGEPVTFRFTGSCDVPPCRIQWRWFGDGGSSLGTAMGEGEEIAYTFDAPGSARVVAEITNSGSTNGSASATQVVVVEPPAPPPGVQDPICVVRESGGDRVRDGGAGEDTSGKGVDECDDDDTDLPLGVA